ncbi:MAG: DUF5666 domain-containing protein [Terracidiphilus sp.]
MSAFVFVLALATASAQNAPTAPAAAQAPAPSSASAEPQPQGGGGWQGQRGGQRGGEGGWGGAGLAGHGISGTVTGVAADRYTLKTDAGETYVVHFSANTHIQKQTAQRSGGGRQGGGEGGDAPPQSLKSTDIKAGDAILAVGETDAAAKTVGAAFILLIDPERAKQMREMQANYGKTWLMGKVTAIAETKVTLLGIVDNAAHIFQADENTTFRKHREPITLADVQVGDTVRVEGAVKGGVFVAASVNVREMPPEGTPTVPRATAPAPAPQPK